MWPFLLLACPRPPLSRPSPDAPEGLPVSEAFRLTPVVWGPTTFTPTEPVDLVIEGAGVRIARNLVFGLCEGSRCVLSHVVPGERVSVYADAAADVTVTALPLPRSTRAVPGGAAPATWDDAEALRGSTSSTTFTLAAASEVRVVATTRHAGAGHTGVHLPDFGLYGPWGPERASVLSQFDDPEHIERTFRLQPGDYAIRAAPEDPTDRLACSIPDFPRPAWCDEATDAGPYELVLRIEVEEAAGEEAPPPVARDTDVRVGLGTLTRRIEPAPELPQRVVDTRPGHDVVLRWIPEDGTVFYAWSAQGGASTRGVCTTNPCVFPAVAFSSLAVSTPHVEQAVDALDLEVTQLLPPPPRDGLSPGHVMTVPIDAWPPKDPRPPFVDVLLRVPGPGTYRVGAAGPEGDAAPSIKLLPGSGWGASALNLSGGPRNYHAEFFEVDEAGSAVARITPAGGVGELEIELQLEE